MTTTESPCQYDSTDRYRSDAGEVLSTFQIGMMSSNESTTVQRTSEGIEINGDLYRPVEADE